MFDRDYSLPIIDFKNFEFGQVGEAFVFGISVLLIGMVTIFAVLCILWLFLIGFKLVFHDLPAKRKAKKKAAPVVNVVEKKAESDKVPDGELVAVIAAAIAAAESEHSGMKFKVVSFKRV